MNNPTKKPSVTCPLCHTSIGRKSDLPRHMRLHASKKDDLMHRCPFQSCNYKNLQKSNVETHIRSHTGEKVRCPSCDFGTRDPGSLIRHRKRLHGYEPKTRQTALPGKVPTTKKSSRHSPYPRKHLDAIRSDVDSNNQLIFLSADSPRPCKLELSPNPNTTLPPSDADYSFSWDKNRFIEGIASLLEQKYALSPIIRSPSPKQLVPAVDSGVLGTSDQSKFWVKAPAPHLPVPTPPPAPVDLVLIAPPPPAPEPVPIAPEFDFTSIPDPAPYFPIIEQPNYQINDPQYPCNPSFPSYDDPASLLPEYIQQLPNDDPPLIPAQYNYPVYDWDQLIHDLNDPCLNAPSPSDFYYSSSSSSSSSSAAASSLSSPHPISSPSSFQDDFSPPPLTPDEFDTFLQSCMV